MNREGLISLFMFAGFVLNSFGQQTIIYGKVLEEFTKEPIAEVEVYLVNTKFIQITKEDGSFIFMDNELPLGEEVLVLRKQNYETQYLPIVVYFGKALNLESLYLKRDHQAYIQDVNFISLSEQDLEQDIGSSTNYSGLLASSKDVFLQAVAFDFSATNFNPRGYGSEYSKLLVNGIPMNKLYHSRPLWSSFIGLNDVMREQGFSMGIGANEYSFGGVGGTTNIQMQASKYKKGGRFSYAVANANYISRGTLSYNTGWTPNNWALSFLISRRFAKEAYVDASLYEAQAFFISVQRKFKSVHSLSFTSFYTPSIRGRTSVSTQEVYDLKSSKYNSYWGWQGGKKRNSRISKVEEPVFMLSHYWQLNKYTKLNTNIAYQFGMRSEMKLGYDKVRNPDPTYYQKLPSYFLSLPSATNKDLSYLAMLAFQKGGQINWEEIYQTNIVYEGPARYYLYDDRIEDKQISGNIFLISSLGKFTFNLATNYRKLYSNNYASMKDLLGGREYLDVSRDKNIPQSNYESSSQLIAKGDKFRYHYKLLADQYDVFLQTQFNYRQLEYYVGLELGNTTYQRQELYKNAVFIGNNYAKSPKLNFLTYGVKMGSIYKISGRHLLDLNIAYYTKAPSLKNVFTDSRESNQTLSSKHSEKVQSLDLSYIYKSSLVKARLTGFYTKISDVSQVSSFFADGVSGLGKNITATYVQEELTGVAKQYQGVELGVEVNLSFAVKIKAAGSLGQYSYANNPNLRLVSRDFNKELYNGEASLKGYKLSSGPEQALQLGLEYRDPRYWWFGVTANHFSNAYVNIVPVLRTKNFYGNMNNEVVLEYDETLVRKLLKQEQLDGFLLINVLGGKSWRKNNKQIGLFASINNLFNQTYKTGGFEQARNINYKTLKEDVGREVRLFGNKYWYGKGITYYLSLYIGF